MKNTAKYFMLLASVLLLGACNLFIDEEQEQRFTDVPVHEGNEYDDVVTGEENGCSYSYQLKRDVRHLGERDLQYIRYVQRDEIGALIEIHYAADTPEELLPVPGEILLSGVNDKFDWGCSHRLQNREFEDGVYKYLGTICNIKEVYEMLELDGQLSTTDVEEYYVVPDESDEADENDEARTRADGDGLANEIRVFCQEHGFTFGLPFGLELSGGYGDVSVGFKMPWDTNFTEVQFEAKFDDFSLTNPVFKLIQTVEEQSDLTFSGSFSKELGFKKKKLKWHPVKGKAFHIGGLVIVFFVDIELHPSIGFEGKANLTRHKKVETTYTIDLYEGTCKTDRRFIINDPWAFDGEASLFFSLELDLSIGFGFYGKVFSVRLVPYLNLTVNAVRTDKTSEDIPDASKSQGISAELKGGGRIRFVVDFTFDALFGSTKTVEATKANLQKAAELYNEHSEFYNQMKDYSETGDFHNNDNKELGISIEILGGTLYQWNIPWYPAIDDNSFKVEKYWETPEKVSVRAQYKIKKAGLLATLPGGSAYCPALRILDGGKRVADVFPEEGGKNANVETDLTYHFQLPNLPPSKQYSAQVCYYIRPWNFVTPKAVDKSLPFQCITPSVVINNVEPTDFIIDNDGAHADKHGKKYMWIYKVKSRAIVEGYQNIKQWLVIDRISGNSHTTDKTGDGKYTFRWKYVYRSNMPRLLNDLRLHIKMEPWYWLEYDESTRRSGASYEIMVYDNGKYDIIDDGSGFSATGLTYHRSSDDAASARSQRGAPAEIDAYGDDMEPEVILESIEAPDGTIVYQQL